MLTLNRPVCVVIMRWYSCCSSRELSVSAIHSKGNAVSIMH